METAVNAIKKFCQSTEDDHNIKLIVIVILAHGRELKKEEQ